MDTHHKINKVYIPINIDLNPNFKGYTIFEDNWLLDGDIIKSVYTDEIFTPIDYKVFEENVMYGSHPELLYQKLVKRAALKLDKPTNETLFIKIGNLKINNTMSIEENKTEYVKNTVKYNSFDETRKYDNEQLRSLLKEVKEIGKLDAPRYAKQSNIMKQLFELEKADYYTWADQFSNVQRAIEIEILFRVRTDAW